MAEIWIAYRDVEGFPREEFEIIGFPPGASLIKPGVLPGKHGYKDLHIAWHEGTLNGDAVHLLTYTEAEVTTDQAGELLQRAYEFVQQTG